MPETAAVTRRGFRRFGPADGAARRRGGGRATGAGRRGRPARRSPARSRRRPSPTASTTNALLRSTRPQRVPAPRLARDGQRSVLRADHLPGLDQAVEDGPPRASVGQLTGRDIEDLELRLALAEAGLPV